MIWKEFQNLKAKMAVLEQQNEDLLSRVFTAPVSGVYFSRFYAHCHGGRRMAVSLFKNDQRQCSVYSNLPQTNGNAANAVVLNLQKGDEMYTRLWEETWVFDDQNSYTSFSGFLLFTL
ncbi:hypothetical protein ACEWY4_006429 [Coilia grayii]|uniref:C1q domain-containing protein n=1 Tax=Coilia grayii TaxID=363190 RepID=A0ABD1KDE6_9TELE